MRLHESWDSLEETDTPLTGAQRRELNRRLDEFEKDHVRGIPWEDVLERIRRRA